MADTGAAAPRVIVAQELQGRATALPEDTKLASSKIKTRVGRSALYEALLSSALLIMAMVADASNGTSGRLTTPYLAAPPINLWFVRPLLGLAVAASGTALWKWRMALHEYWLWRYKVALVFLVLMAVWAVASTCASVAAVDALGVDSPFNYNLRVQLVFGILLNAALAVVGGLYTASLARFWAHYQTYEFDPAVDGFAEHGPVPCTLFAARVLGCRKLPKPKALQAALPVATFPAVEEGEVEVDLDSWSSAASSPRSGSSSSSAASTPLQSPQRALPSAPPVAFPAQGASTPPLAPSTPPLGSPPPSAPPVLPPAAPTAGGGITPAAFAAQWEDAAALGGFDATVTTLPTVDSITAHLAGRGFLVVASGAVDGEVTVFAAHPATAPVVAAACLLRLAVDEGNEAVSVQFRGGPGVASRDAAAALGLAALFGALQAQD